MYLCLLQRTVFCPMRREDNKCACKSGACGFREEVVIEALPNKPTYVRKERWYEKYYREPNKSEKKGWWTLSEREFKK